MKTQQSALLEKKGSNINALILGIIVKLKIIVITLLNTEE